MQTAASDHDVGTADIAMDCFISVLSFLFLFCIIFLFCFRFCGFFQLFIYLLLFKKPLMLYKKVITRWSKNYSKFSKIKDVIFSHHYWRMERMGTYIFFILMVLFWWTEINVFCMEQFRISSDVGVRKIQMTKCLGIVLCWLFSWLEKKIISKMEIFLMASPQVKPLEKMRSSY